MYTVQCTVHAHLCSLLLNDNPLLLKNNLLLLEDNIFLLGDNKLLLYDNKLLLCVNPLLLDDNPLLLGDNPVSVSVLRGHSSHVKVTLFIIGELEIKNIIIFSVLIFHEFAFK